MKMIVVKVGTNVLSRPDGRLDVTNISRLVDEIAALKQRGISVVLVSSGAVGAGRELLPTADKLDDVVRRQILSAIGQPRLMELYRRLFGGHGLLCAQVLATRGDFRDRQHYLNMRNCFTGLLHDRVLPVVNENDVVAVTELMFTDNDELAGLVAGMLEADALVILSTVAGLYDGPPDHPDSRLIERVDPDDEDIAARYVQAGTSSFGRGGMQTKLRMAQRTARLGTDVYLGDGRRAGLLTELAAGNFHGTHVPAGEERVSGVKRFLAQRPTARAGVTVNAGAAAELRNPGRVSSLLPVGVTAVAGDFTKGEVILITGPDGETVGLGLAQYDSGTARAVLGKRGERPLVHYDYLWIG
ncbi:MAG: glutamate 5-kinase [Saprospiraceae bacterium]